MINIAKLLKDATKGMPLYSPLFGNVELSEVRIGNDMPIRITRGYAVELFDEYGRYYKGFPDAECLLFPSKDCRTWEGWKLSVEPKFKVGDWIVQNDNGTVSQITKTINGKDEYGEYRAYEHTNGYFAACFENEYHLWTIEDAKPGDVLMCESGWTCIFKDSDLFNEMFSSYCFMATDLDFMPYSGECHTLDSRVNGKLTPATEKQRNLFFKKMKKAGYQWDKDKKELHEIINPKFKVGDWVVSNGQPTIIYELKSKYYLGKYLNGHDFCHKYADEDKLRLWTIKDAKDGDVLNLNGFIFIFKGIDENNGVRYYCYYAPDNHEDEGEFGTPVVPGSIMGRAVSFDSGLQYRPATEKQRVLLFKKMREAGYEWDADKKELRKIQHYDIANFYAGMPVLVRQYNDCKWDYSVFSRNVDNQYWHFAVCNGVSFTQCIPFNEETKHLLGTSDPCDKKYINW